MPMKICKQGHQQIVYEYGQTIGDDRCPLCAKDKDDELTRKQKQTIADHLETLRNSCLEGLDETWDCSTKEGREGFEPMANSCEKIADILGIDLLASGSTPL